MILSKQTRVFFTILFFITAPCVAKYKDTSPQQKALLKQADSYFRYGYHNNAIKAYLKYLKKSPDNAQANYNLGFSYDLLRFEEKALPYYKKAYEVDPEVEKDILLRLSRSLQVNEEFEEAIQKYQKYRSTHNLNSEQSKMIERYIYECKNGIEFKKNPHEDLDVVNLGSEINSPEHDFSPLIDADGKTLIFSSKRKGASNGVRSDETGELWADIYISHFVNGVWERAKPIDAVNTDLEDGSVYLSPDGNTLLIYSGSNENNSDIFMSKRGRDGKWNSLEPLSKTVNKPNSHEYSATMSEDQLTLIFSSDRAGGEGGVDLYISKRGHIDDEWGEVSNLSTLNTEYDEDSPFLDVEGTTLYFCSKGHKGMGLYDIYRSELDPATGKWSEPENLGYPINSGDNDLFFYVTHDGKYAYFNSNKHNGEGGQDLYRMKMPKKLKKEEEQEEEVVEEAKPIYVTINGMVLKNTSGPVPGASVQLLHHDGAVVNSKTAGADGSFAIEVAVKNFQTFRLKVEKQGFESRVVSFYADGTKKNIQKNITLNEIIKEVPVPQVIVSRNIFFDFNSYKINPSSYPALDKIYALLNSNQKSFEIAGHTDNVGSDENNLRISRLRSKSVMEYLVSKGIDRSRITTTGYGESQPLVSNDDEIDGREVNRRIEFIFK